MIYNIICLQNIQMEKELHFGAFMFINTILFEFCIFSCLTIWIKIPNTLNIKNQTHFHILMFIWHLFPLVEQLVVPNTTTATLSSTLEGYPASNAVDGNVNSSDISTCSHTHDNTSKTEAWIYIDLKNTYSIESVKFWYSECMFVCLRNTVKACFKGAGPNLIIKSWLWHHIKITTRQD